MSANQFDTSYEATYDASLTSILKGELVDAVTGQITGMVIQTVKNQFLKLILGNERSVRKGYSDYIDKLANSDLDRYITDEVYREQFKRENMPQFIRTVNDSVITDSSKATHLGSKISRMVDPTLDPLKIKDAVLDKIYDGGIYKDGLSVPERLLHNITNDVAGLDEQIYQRIANKTSALEIRNLLLDKQIYPTKWEALRTARTTINQSFHQADIESAIASKDVRGLRWVLSNAHPKLDVCDDYSKHDEGLGIGVWTPETVPLSHPNCLCILVPVVNDLIINGENITQEFEEIREQQDIANAQQYIIDHPEGFSLDVDSGITAKHGYMVEDEFHSLKLTKEELYSPEGQQRVADYLEKYMDDFSQEGQYLGSWYNPDDNYYYIGRSKLIDERRLAIATGKTQNQISIFDVARMDTIDTGGSGVVDFVMDSSGGGKIIPGTVDISSLLSDAKVSYSKPSFLSPMDSRISAMDKYGEYPVLTVGDAVIDVPGTVRVEKGKYYDFFLGDISEENYDKYSEFYDSMGIHSKEEFIANRGLFAKMKTAASSEQQVSDAYGKFYGDKIRPLKEFNDTPHGILQKSGIWRYDSRSELAENLLHTNGFDNNREFLSTVEQFKDITNQRQLDARLKEILPSWIKNDSGELDWYGLKDRYDSWYKEKALPILELKDFQTKVNKDFFWDENRDFFHYINANPGRRDYFNVSTYDDFRKALENPSKVEDLRSAWESYALKQRSVNKIPIADILYSPPDYMNNSEYGLLSKYDNAKLKDNFEMVADEFYRKYNFTTDFSDLADYVGKLNGNGMDSIHGLMAVQDTIDELNLGNENLFNKTVKSLNLAGQWNPLTEPFGNNDNITHAYFRNGLIKLNFNNITDDPMQLEGILIHEFGHSVDSAWNGIDGGLIKTYNDYSNKIIDRDMMKTILSLEGKTNPTDFDVSVALDKIINMDASEYNGMYYGRFRIPIKQEFLPYGYSAADFKENFATNFSYYLCSVYDVPSRPIWIGKDSSWQYLDPIMAKKKAPTLSTLPDKLGYSLNSPISALQYKTKYPEAYATMKEYVDKVLKSMYTH